MTAIGLSNKGYDVVSGGGTQYYALSRELLRNNKEYINIDCAAVGGRILKPLERQCPVMRAFPR